MKKSIVSIILCLALACGGTANAWVQIVAPVIAIGAGALIAAGLNLAVTYGMLPSSATSHVIASTGDISRRASANYIEIDMSKIPVARSKPVTAHMPFSVAQSMSGKLKSDGTYEYPAAHAAFNVADASPLSPTSLVGNIVVAPLAGTVKITSKTSSCPGGAYYYSPTMNYCNSYNTQCYTANTSSSFNGTNYYCMYVYNVVPAVPVTRPRTGPEFHDAVADSGGYVTGAALQSELDKMFQDPTYTPTFTDDSTGLPYAPPAGLPSAAQIKAAVDSYNRAGALAESRSNVQSANAGAVAAAQGAADAAHAAAQQASGASAANPGDSGLAYAAAQAAAAAAAADAALAQAKADQAKSDNAFTNMSAVSSDNTPAFAESTDGGTATGLGGLLINRLKTTAGLLAAHAPLSYISGAVDLVSSLIVDPVAPSIDLPLGPWVGDLHISASWFDPLATLTRFFSWLLFILSAAWSFKGYWHRS